MKKLLLVGLCILALAPMLFANGEQEVAKDINISAPGVYPISDEKLTFHIFCATEPWVEDLNTNHMTLYIEELMNVDLIFEQTTGENAEEIVNLKIATGANMPDIFMGHGMNADCCKAYGEQGIFLALDDYIERQGVNTKEFFQYMPEAEDYLKAMDGKIYGLPAFNECFHCSYSQRMLINKKWLDNLGLDVPKTTEEFYQALKAFKEQDANGNGDPNDEIPLTQITKHCWNGKLDGFLTNPFTFSPLGHNNDTRIYVKDGEIIASYAQPGYREALKFVNKLYKEGLVFRESFTVDVSQVKSMVEHPDGNMIGAVPSGTISQICSLVKCQDRCAEYIVLPPLVGPTGLQQTMEFTPSVKPNRFNITNVCKYPEAAFKIGDFLMYLGHNLDGSYNEKKLRERLQWSEEGVDFDFDVSHKTTLLGTPAWYEDLSSYGASQNRHWGSGRPDVNTRFSRLSGISDAGGFDQGQFLYDAAVEYRKYAKAYLIPPVNMTEDELRQKTEYHQVFKEFNKEAYANFVIGNLDPNSDDDWNTYLNQLENMGLSKYIALLQSTYDRQYKK